MGRRQAAAKNLALSAARPMILAYGELPERQYQIFTDVLTES